MALGRTFNAHFGQMFEMRSVPNNANTSEGTISGLTFEAAGTGGCQGSTLKDARCSGKLSNSEIFCHINDTTAVAYDDGFPRKNLCDICAE